MHFFKAAWFGGNTIGRMRWHVEDAPIEAAIATVADNLGSDLDQLLPQRGQGPVLHLLRQRKRPHEVAQIVGQGVKLETNLVVAELPARQPGPLDRVLAFLDVLLRRPPVIIKRHHPLGCSGHHSWSSAKADRLGADVRVGSEPDVQ